MISDLLFKRLNHYDARVVKLRQPIGNSELGTGILTCWTSSCPAGRNAENVDIKVDSADPRYQLFLSVFIRVLVRRTRLSSD